MIPESTSEEWVATLLHPDEYAANVNNVATVTTDKIVYIKRKELALKPFERLEYPIAECTAITYKKHYAIGSFVAGLAAILLVLGIVWGFAVYGANLQPGTRVSIGAVLAVAVFGAFRVSGIKRHRLTFKVGSSEVRWQSRAGEFKSKEVSVQKVAAFAEEKGLWRVQS